MILNWRDRYWGTHAMPIRGAGVAVVWFDTSVSGGTSSGRLLAMMGIG